MVVLFISGLFVLGFGEYGANPNNYVGCYAYDALLVGFNCSGFPASDLVAFALEFPLYYLYMPIFVIWNPALIFVWVIISTPPIVLIIAHNKVEER